MVGVAVVPLLVVGVIVSATVLLVDPDQECRDLEFDFEFDFDECRCLLELFIK